MAENISEHNAERDQARTFLEETATVFKVPALIILAALTLATLLTGTYLTADLLDRVLLAFSRAAATKSDSFIGSNFRNLFAAGVWFFALTALFKNVRLWITSNQVLDSSRRPDRLVPLCILVVLAVFFLLYPDGFGFVPLLVPLGILMALGLIHVITRTRISAIALHELSTLLLNPLGYVVLTVFSVVLAILFFGAVDRLTLASPTSEINIAPLKAFFGTADVLSRELNFLVIALLLVVPVITMRLLAEEKRSGTEEVLLTAPVREWHVIVGKFSGTLLFYLIMWTIALVPILFLSFIGTLDTGQVMSSFIGIFIIGFGLLGMGVLASSITRNQLAAAVLTFLGMLLFTFQSFTTLPDPTGDFGWLRTAALYMDLRQHLAWIARGTIDSRTVFLFLSCGVFTLFLSIRALETRRWAGFSLARRLTGARTVLGVLGFLGIIAILIWMIHYTGKAQVTKKLALQEAMLAEQQASEAEAKRKPDPSEQAKALFKDVEEVKKTQDRITSTEKKGEAKPEDKTNKEDEKGEAKPDDKTNKEEKEDDKKTEDTAVATAKETLPSPEPEWTPRRILWILGTALILLMAYLAIAARVLSGGLQNQIVFGSNVIVGSLAALTLVVLANYLATRNHKAVDLSHGKVYSLTPAIKDTIDDVLDEGEIVEVVALVGRYASADDRNEVDDNIRRDALERIFQKFAEAFNRPGVLRFQATFIDPERQRDKKKQLINEYNISGQHEVILRYRNRHEILHNDDLFNMVPDTKRFMDFLEDWKDMIRHGRFGVPPLPPTRQQQFDLAELWWQQQGSPHYLRKVQPRPEIEKVLGEAIAQLVESEGNNLYFTVGHGEKKLDIRRKAAELEMNFGEASLLRRTFSLQNFNLLPLEPLTGDRDIPSRCNYLLIAGPTEPFSAEEIKKIEDFVNNGGNLIVFTEGSHESGLAPLLKTFAVEIEKSQIWMGGPPRDRRMAMMGQLQPITPIVVGTVKASADSKDPQNPEYDHPITQALANLGGYPMGGQSKGARTVMLLASPIQILKTGEAAEKWKVTPLLEIKYMMAGARQLLRPYATTELDKPQTRKNPADRNGPFDLAVLCEARGEKPGGTQGKVLVVSDTDFIEDRLKPPKSFGMERTSDWSPFGVLNNQHFVVAALDYLKKRPPRIQADISPPRTFSGDFKASALNTAPWVLWAGMPLFFLSLCFLVFIVRRRA